MEMAGLVIGAASLGFQLFGICLDAFSLIETAQNLGTDGAAFAVCSNFKNTGCSSGLKSPVSSTTS